MVRDEWNGSQLRGTNVQMFFDLVHLLLLLTRSGGDDVMIELAENASEIIGLSW